MTHHYLEHSQLIDSMNLGTRPFFTSPSNVTSTSMKVQITPTDQTAIKAAALSQMHQLNDEPSSVAADFGGVFFCDFPSGVVCACASGLDLSIKISKYKDKL